MEKSMSERMPEYLFSSIHQAMGAASMALIPVPSTEVFDSTRAADIALELCRDVADWHEAEVATLTTERDRYRADSERFEWLAGALDFDVKLGDADPEEFVTEENQSPVDAWRKAVDCVLGLGRAEALAGTGETG